MASRIGDLIWFGPLRRFQKLFFHTPLVYPFILGSYLYHDLLWWSMVGNRRMKAIERDTEWGKFFARYPES